MSIRRIAHLLPAFALVVLFCACATGQSAIQAESAQTRVEAVVYADGLYRGVYNDGGLEQFSVSFTLRDNRFVSVRLDSVNYRDGDYLSPDATRIQEQVSSQYSEAAAYLIGKTVSSAADLMDASLVATDRDAVTTATLRTNKLLSALRDGLRRGVYTPYDASQLRLPQSAQNGVYRGSFYSDAKELVLVEFTLQDSHFADVSVLLSDGESPAANTPQEACQALLDGQPLTTLSVLYDNDTQALLQLSQSDVSGSMIASAFMDALNRNIFAPTDETEYLALGGYESGVYRGFFYAGGTERVSVQFELVNDTFGAFVFRGLSSEEGDCLAEDASSRQTAIAAQFREMADYLSGRSVSSVYDLFEPEQIVSDSEDSPLDELPVGELVSAIMDGLGCGVYRLLEID